MLDAGKRYEYLMQGLTWPRFTWQGLEQDSEGRLTLARVPRLTATIAAGEPAEPLDPQGPAGIATAGDCGCDIYVSDPARHAIWRIDSCEPEPAGLPCLTGPGTDLGRLDRPRGLAIARTPWGPRLYVADSGNHRVQVIDLETQQPLAALGQADAIALPVAGTAPGELNEPWDVAVDGAGGVYVVDHGNARVQKFRASGAVVAAFATTMAAVEAPEEPVSVAVGSDKVYVLDRGAESARVFVYSPDGNATQGPWDVDGLASAISLTATASAVYVAALSGVIVKLGLDGIEMGRTSLGQSLAVLKAGCQGELLASGGGLPVWRLHEDAGFVERGWFRAGPFSSIERPFDWQRWRVEAGSIGAGSALQLSTLSAGLPDEPPTPAAGDHPFAGAGWFAQPVGVTDVLVLSQEVRNALTLAPPIDSSLDPELPVKTTHFWLGGLLQGEGASSPAIRQMRIDYHPETGIGYLPSVYREGPLRRLVVELMLASLGSELSLADEALRVLPGYFEPAATPAEWLKWLAGWLDFQLLESWPEAEARANVAGAMDLYTMRGTAEGLRRYLQIYAGVEARIEEPAAALGLFRLDDGCRLGFNSGLAPASADGAIAGSGAVLGQSHLLASEDAGAPLFSDLVNRFGVLVYASQLGPRERGLLEQVLQRERPAQTDYHLCVIEPAMRVGMQSRLGIDSIVAGPAPDMALGEADELGIDTVLANRPPRSRRAGQGARVGGVI